MEPSVKIHYDYARYIVSHGTPEEKQNLRGTLGVMNELITVFPGGGWEPMSGIYLINDLVDLAERVAKRRLKSAKELKYGDHQGKIGRTLDEERWSARGQIAAQTMLGLPKGKPDTYMEARVVGNMGNGHEAFVPWRNPIKHNLIVDPSTPDEIVSWLVVPEGDRFFRLDGWIKAEEAKQDIYLHRREREGGVSVAYWVPPSALHSVEEWWNQISA